MTQIPDFTTIDLGSPLPTTVIPAKAGTQSTGRETGDRFEFGRFNSPLVPLALRAAMLVWVPAFAGMSAEGVRRRCADAKPPKQRKPRLSVSRPIQ